MRIVEDFKLNWARVWWIDAEGVSKGFRPSGIIVDWATIWPLRRLVMRFGWMNTSLFSFLATDMIKSKPIFPEPHCNSSTKLSDGVSTTELLPEANKIIFFVKEWSLSHLVFSFLVVSTSWIFLDGIILTSSSSAETDHLMVDFLSVIASYPKIEIHRSLCQAFVCFENL